MKKIHFCKEEILLALRSVGTGVVRKQAAKKLGISERTLQKNMNFYDITMRDWKPKEEHIIKEGWGAYKLSFEKAIKIREMFYEERMEIKDIAKKYDVTFSTISRIVRNITYKENKTKFGGEAKINVDYRPK